ncbi:hypothetical protein PG984_016665 [Apiospora sp. TS-2023a]
MASALLFADVRALDDGLMLLCQLENNGQVLTQARVWPFSLSRYWPHDPWSAERMIIEFDLEHEEQWMGGVNMENEIMDILEGLPAHA